MVRHRIDEVKTEKQAQSDDAVGILELTHNLARQSATLSTGQKRPVAEIGVGGRF